MHWTANEIVLRPIRPPGHSGLSSDDLRDALESGARAWNDALAGSGAPRIRVAPVADVAADLRRDGVSLVLVRRGSWCPPGARDTEDCYDKRRAAITHLYPIQQPGGANDGEVREADIEINAVDFEWSLDGAEPGKRSLRAIVAHELGHVLGLDHGCAPLPGGTLPPCSAPSARASIMYPSPVEPGRPVVLGPGADEVDTIGRTYANHRARQ